MTCRPALNQVALRTAGASSTSTPLVAGPITVLADQRTSGVGHAVCTARVVTSSEVPAPPAPGMVRVRWVNASSLTLTPS